MLKPSTKLRNPMLLATCALVGLLTVGCSTGDNAETPDASGNGNTTAPAGDSCDFAPDFPSGPIEMTVPFAAGGGTDATARALADELSQLLDTQVNVVNRTGGGGVVGSQFIAAAKNDGSVIGIITPESAVAQFMGLADLSPESYTPLAQGNFDGGGIVVSADSPFNSVQEVLDYAAENPGELTASGTSAGGSWHMALVGLLLDQGLPANAIEWVPSEGAAPALQEVVAGGIDISAASVPEARTLLEADRVKALAVMAEDPVKGFEEVPTLQDEGIDYAGGVWRGFAGPAGMPEDVVQELSCHMEDIINGEAYNELLESLGFGVVFRNAADFTTFLAEDTAARGVVIEAAGFGG